MDFYNSRTRIAASVIGVLLGLTGLVNHGLFEMLQGNTPTNGLFIEAIGKSHRFWTYGTEGAITLIPNFLVTGVIVLLFSLAIVIWSIGFIHKRHGATVFLLLSILLTLVGGGIAHIVLFLPTWGYATRINKSLSWWQKTLPAKRTLSKVWMLMLVTTILLWLMIMELGIFGFFPGQSNADVLLNITLGSVLLTVVFVNLTFVCGFARDLEERTAIVGQQLVMP